MKSWVIFVLLASCILVPAVLFLRPSADQAQGPVVARVNGYVITEAEFEQGFAASAFAARADIPQARKEYLDTLISQKLILLDAQKRDIDKAPDFLKSVERFWAQSLLTAALGQKTMELRRGIEVSDEDVRRIYQNMIKDGATTKPLNEVFSQIKWQAEKQLEVQLLNGWVESLRRNATIEISGDILQKLK